ncbi:MAG: toprim domain-containing protein, partial [Betaproteobacteria bacterium]|nr:toprim domain-containing protein [Betaproteobacteria bacterium]
SDANGHRFTGLAAGSKKDRGGFHIGTLARAKAIYLVEAAIDAVSLFWLRHEAGERDFAVVSTAGTTPEPRKWFAGLARSVRRVCAFDADEAGDKSALALRRHKFERMRPTRGKDWNDELRATVRGAATSSSLTDPFLSSPNDNNPSP